MPHAVATRRVRSNLKLTENTSNMLVVLCALHDFSSRPLMGHAHAHPPVGMLVDTDPEFIRLVRTYLQYRRAPRPSPYTVHPTPEGNARVWDKTTRTALDLVSLPTSGGDRVRLRALLEVALRYHCEASLIEVERVERAIGEACGRKLSSVEDLYQSHRAVVEENRHAA